jgi:hypothetical protein
MFGGFTDHQTLMVDARLHPADVIAHDEEDIGFIPVGTDVAAVLVQSSAL